MSPNRKAVAGLLCLFAAGCAVGPTPERPHLRTPPPASFVNASSREEQPTGLEAMTRWWEQIKDPAFNGHVDILLSANLSLQEARERVTQARERLAMARGGRLPSASVDGAAGRAFTTNSAGERDYLNSVSADLNVSWTADLFGRRRRSIEASEASFLSTAAEHEALSHTLIAELLNRRVAIAVNARLLELAEQNASNRALLRRIVQGRYDLGVSGTALSDVYLAEENLTTVQADVPQYQRLLAEELYRLDLLLGRTPGSTRIDAANFPVLDPPSPPPVSIPGALLDRRPDLRASELRARAATANVGVAIADLYPQLTLGGSIGVAGDSTSHLLTSEQLVGSLLGSISQQLFAGGALRANVRLQEAAARELATRYANDVLDALREVETALKADAELERQLAAQTLSLEALRAAEAVSETRYRSGILTLQDLLDTQQRRYRAEQNWLLIQQLRWSTRISLYLALGGDWTNTASARTGSTTSNSRKQTP